MPRKAATESLADSDAAQGGVAAVDRALTQAQFDPARINDPIVRQGTFELILADDPHVYAFTRTLDGEQLLVFGNFTGQERSVSYDLGDVSLVLGNYSDALVSDDGLRLRPWEAVVLRAEAAGE